MNFGTGALWMQGVGAVNSAVASWYSARAQRSALETQAFFADLNARQAESQAQTALAAGEREQQRGRLATAGLKSRQRVGMAANGIDLGEGSAQRVLTSTDVMGEIDANTIAANAVRAAWGYRTEAVNQRNNAAASRARADGISPLSAVGASLLGSAQGVAASWYKLQQSGALETERLNRANDSADPLGTYGASKGWW